MEQSCDSIAYDCNNTKSKIGLWYCDSEIYGNAELQTKQHNQVSQGLRDKGLKIPWKFE